MATSMEEVIFTHLVSMFEMVTGRVPFDGDTTVGSCTAALTGGDCKAKHLRTDLPISFEKIILKCTQKFQPADTRPLRSFSQT